MFDADYFCEIKFIVICNKTFSRKHFLQIYKNLN